MPARSQKQKPQQRETNAPVSFLWGLALVGASLLIALALLSFHEADMFPRFIGDSIAWDSASGDSQVHNWVGAWGAKMAFILGPYFLGRWAAFGIPIIIFLWGWLLMRRLEWRETLKASIWLFAFMIWLSTFIGLAGSTWFGIEEASRFHAHAGLFGDSAARYLVGVLGFAGSIIMTLLLLVIGLALSVSGFGNRVERSVNTSIDKVSAAKLPKVSIKKPAFPKFRLKLPSFKRKKAVKSVFDAPLGETDPERSQEADPETASNGHADKRIEDLAEVTSKPSGKRKPGAVERSTAQISIAVDDSSGYIFPPLDCFDLPKPGQEGGMSVEEQRKNAELLVKSLDTFGVQAKLVKINPGPVITRFDLEPAPGVKVSRIEALADDLSLALRARGLRILAPIPGVAAVGVEMANNEPALVSFREVVESTAFQESKSKLPLALGRSVSGDIVCTDLEALPHLLIAGTTGSGKSVCVNTIINSILLRSTPDEVQMVMIDPKKLELAAYNELRKHHVTHRPDLTEFVITRPDEAVKVLRSCLMEMERRYDLLAEFGSRNLREFNEAVRSEPREGVTPLPYIIVIIDELADLMVTAQREVEEPIARLAQLARAIGIHLVVATQRPSVDVITGVIKANFPARIAFRVAMKVDSRTILDANGAEMLLGQGDMLFQHPEDPAPVRIQGALLKSKEIAKVISHIRKQPGPRDKLVLPLDPQEEKESGGGTYLSIGNDPLFVEAAKIVVRTGQGSVSILQRRLKIGYSRAARLIDHLEEAGVVGPFDGSKARVVLADEEFLDSLTKADE
ncbi:DNA translocase FtsK [bacterium]|nr:DNA translocase FtsK [bacterium]